VLRGAGRVVCGWGCHGSLLGRAAAVRAAGLLPAAALCFGLTRGGEPRHPLYLRGDACPLPLSRGARGEPESDTADNAADRTADARASVPPLPRRERGRGRGPSCA